MKRVSIIDDVTVPSRGLSFNTSTFTNSVSMWCRSDSTGPLGERSDVEGLFREQIGRKICGRNFCHDLPKERTRRALARAIMTFVTSPCAAGRV